MAAVRTLCGQCSVGCGIRAVPGDGRDLSVSGDPAHPANGGLLCAGSEALADMLTLEGRLLDPMLNGRRVGWERIVGQIAQRLRELVSRHGPGGIAMHVSGGLLTEDYYVANKLMKGFIGSAHIDGPCSREGGAAHSYRAALGEDVAPGAYEDIEQADLILAVGGSIARRHPVLFERIQAARGERGARLILLASDDEGGDIDADLRLDVKTGSEATLLNGLLLRRHDSGALSDAFLNRSVAAPPDFWTALQPRHDLWSVARSCGLAPAEVRAFYDVFASSSRTMTIHAEGGEREGSRLSRAILNLHLAMGWIGKPGATPMAIPASPNAMGAREVGCVNGDLAAHMDFAAEARTLVARFWAARRMAEGTGLQGLELVDSIESGRIKALWMIGGLPPESDPLRSVLHRVPVRIVSTPWLRDGLGDVIALPSPVWIEKDGTLTGADRLISRQRRLFPLPGAAKPDWWSVTQVARAMGWGDAFHYERPAEIYREHVRLTAYENEGDRLLNLKRHAPISNPAYDELTPWRWGELPFDDGRFPTADGRARLLEF